MPERTVRRTMGGHSAETHPYYPNAQTSHTRTDTLPTPPPIRRRNTNNSAGLFFGEMLPSHQDYGPGPPNTLSLWLLCCQRHVETLIS